MKVSISIFLLTVCFVCLAKTTIRQNTYKNEPVYTLENEKLLLSIAPSRGGRGVRFYLKDHEQELVGEHNLGFFLDHWSAHTWPSGLMHLPYSAEEVKSGEEVGIRLKITVPTLGGGKGDANSKKSLNIPTDKEFRGLEIIKTIWLKNDSNMVQVDMEVRNPTEQSRSCGLHIQHAFRMSPNADNFRWDMPSDKGIYGPTRQNGGKVSGPFWIEKPTAGWMSVTDFKGRISLIFEFDYNYLDRLYSCGQTAEWVMEPVLLSSGQSFKTTYRIHAASDFERITHANKGLLAGIRAYKKGDDTLINLDIAANDKPLENLKVRLKTFSYKDKTLRKEQVFSVKSLSRKRQSFVTLSPGKEEIVIKAEVTGPNDMNECFEYNYLDERTEYERRFNYGQIGNGAAALAGGKGSGYSMKQPLKIKKTTTPDFSKIAKFPKDKNKILVLFGLYTEHLQIYETFCNVPNTLIHWCNARPNGIESFPAKYEDLFQFRTVFMCNVNSKSLRFHCLEMLRNYVAQGGTIVITGGFYTYGHGEFQGTPFEEFVPFEDMNPFDLVWSGKEKFFELRKASGTHEELTGLDFSKKIQAAWVHKVKLKKGTEVLVFADSFPAIAKKTYGKGMVIACTLAPLGIPENPWWSWTGWKTFLENCCKINQN